MHKDYIPCTECGQPIHIDRAVKTLEARKAGKKDLTTDDLECPQCFTKEYLEDLRNEKTD